MQVDDRIRPYRKTTYKANFEWFSVEFNLNHHQLWEISSIKDGIYTLNNSSYTMKLTLDEKVLHEHFDTSRITRGRYTGRWDIK